MTTTIENKSVSQNIRFDFGTLQGGYVLNRVNELFISPTSAINWIYEICKDFDLNLKQVSTQDLKEAAKSLESFCATGNEGTENEGTGNEGTENEGTENEGTGNTINVWFSDKSLTSK